MNFSRFSPRAICAGFLADILASQILVSTLTLAVVAKSFGVAALGAPAAQMTQMMNSLQSAPGFYVPSTALGLLGCTIGGYVAAHLSEREGAWRNAIAAGSLCLLLSLVVVFESRGTPAWILAVALALSLPATLLGAFLSLGGRETQDAAPIDSGENSSDEL